MLLATSRCAEMRRLDPKATAAVMREADLEPLDPYPGSNEPWRCACMKCGKVVTPNYASVNVGAGGCAWCAGNKIDPADAVAAMRSVGVEPLVPYPGSMRPWKCRCLTCDHEVTPTYGAIRNGQGGCIWCSGHKVELSTRLSVMDGALLTPLVPYPGNNKAPWLCRCQRCGKEVTPNYNCIQKGQGGCGWCSGRKKEHAEVEAVMRRASLEPLVPYPGSDAPWLCRCLGCSAEVAPRYGDINRGQGGCRQCGLDRSARDRIAAGADGCAARMRSCQLEPLVPYPGSHEPWPCRCTGCRREVAPSYHQVQSGRSGCRWCARWGPDWAKPGFVYLITRDALNAHKIGIRNETPGRMDRHRRHGWTVYRERRFELAVDAFKVEQAIIRWWRTELCQPVYLSADEMPQGGWTETVSADALSLPDIWSKVCELADRQRTSDPDSVCDDVGLGQLVLF